MPRARPQRRGAGRGAPDSSDSDDSSASDEDARLLPERYAAANIRHGLESRNLRVRALQELRLIAEAEYRHADKRLQAAIFEDLLAAARASDSRQAARQAQAAVIDAAKRLLPQQRRAQLLAEAKRAGLAAARERRRARAESGGGGGGDSSDEGEGGGGEGEGEGELTFSDVPDEVTRVILASLDPVSLGRAACACRAWRGMVLADAGVWAGAVQRVFRRRGEARMAAAAAAAAHAPGRPVAAAAAGAVVPGGGAGGGAGGPAQGCDGAGRRGGVGAGGEGALGTGELAALFAALAAERPQCLLPWRACRVLAGGRLLWQERPGGAQQAAAEEARRAGGRLWRWAPKLSYPSPLQALDWMRGGDGGAGSSRGGCDDGGSSGGGSGSGSGGSASGSSSESERAAPLTTRMRLWALPKE